jgi:hypothetical protein
MTIRSVPDELRDELAHRMNQGARAAELLRSAADRLEAGTAAETRSEQAARMRGSAVLAHTAALELAASSGWFEALATAEQNEARE